MTTTFKPENADQVVEAVAWAAAEEAPLEVMGRGSKRAFGRPVQAANGIDVSDSDPAPRRNDGRNRRAPAALEATKPVTPETV